MKQVIFSIAIVSLTLLSCNKPYPTGSVSATLEGNWRMMIVKNNTSGTIITKPADIQGNVDITFLAINSTSGSLNGHTPTNLIVESNYSTDTNRRLSIPVLVMTKVAETSWGSEFVNNIRSSQKYHFETDGKLVIETLEKTLTFQRQ